NAIREAAATEKAKTEATVCVSASSTTRSTRVHNAGFLEDEVPTPILAPVSHSRNVNCSPHCCDGAEEWRVVAGLSTLLA
ncbi:unnamed protein product, partial [Rangifer tarandus platyrhynchus]